MMDAAQNGEQTALESIIKDTTLDVFELAGGYEFTDEIAVKLAERWRKHQGPVVPVAVIDLAWLLDGYARARGATTPDASGPFEKVIGPIDEPPSAAS